ncbi:hypothetical protein JKL49_16275 [Phenylobacterium sp. 20VBR1]|uniref:Uncharacterized protein n=1 Tax=Phenylobacterium glaciei TaxID=2803784 RepID=A0A941D2Z9_9CAUL|nr:hypothetical protein [Phenylobacterium glaciei]MBR7620952.1 hypothetical protein [Phenylobacterium glaciei]
MESAPWSAAWSGEASFTVGPSTDFPGFLELNQAQAPGKGEPLFGAMNATRLRRGMVDLLCHVCGRPTVRQDRYIFPVASGGLVTLLDGSQQYGCNVPPMHRACALRASHACPHLGKVSEAPLRCTRDEGRLIHRTDITPGLEGVVHLLPKGVDVVLSCYRLYGDEFTAKVLAARESWEKVTMDRRARRVRPPS